MNYHAPSLQRSLSDVVAEYEMKLAAIPAAIEAFEQAGRDLKSAATVGGTISNVRLNVGNICEGDIELSLRKSAWLHVYEGLHIEVLASPREKDRFRSDMERPPEFSLDNVRATFGRYVQDPRGSILRSFAEVFCDLDPAYKSHEKMKIGVNGLPKRVILTGVSSYSEGWGRSRLVAMINALAAYRGVPFVEYAELRELDDLHGIMGHKAGEVRLCARAGRVYRNGRDQEVTWPDRGLFIRKFQNGNAHVYFDADALRDINRALAEFYGDVLPDTTEEKPDKPRASTAVARDLQYYPTPVKIVEEVLSDIYIRPGQLALDPSCGCGRILTGLRKAGAIPFGIEVDAGRVAQARGKGFDVRHANFLECEPVPKYDHVVMNPPFYGRHYAKHVEHALRFLRPGGRLTAILPITARYDHGLIKSERWRDLPVGSFAESGTNINTTVVTLFAACK